MYSVLYVDDEETLLELTKLFLERSGEFQVEISSSALDALELLKSRSFDAIISDYQMPGMDGIAFLKEIRARQGDIPFILFTGRGREEVVIQAINYGVDFYLQKGGDPRAEFAELAHKIKIAIERRHAINSLKDSEQRLADIINFLPDATFAIDRSGRVIAWNHAIEDMTGVPASGMIGKGDFEYSLPFYSTRRKILIDLIFEAPETIARQYSHIIHEKNTLIAETSLPRPKGKAVILMGKAGPLFNRRQEIVGAIESIRDITGMKQAEADLRAEEEKYRVVVENSNDGIYIHRNSRFLFANERAAELSGYPLDELMSREVWDFIHPDDRARLMASGKRRIAGDVISSVFSARILTKSGAVKEGEFFVDRIIYQGQPAILGIVREITGKRRNERILKCQLDLGLSLQKIHGMKETLDACLSAALDVSELDAGGIYLVDQKTGSVDLAVHRNLDEAFVRDVAHYPAGSANAKMVMRGTPVYTEFEKTGLIDTPAEEQEGIRAIGIIPISFGGRITACLNAGSHTFPDISESARIALEALAIQIGAVIERVRSEESLLQSERKYRALIETTRTGYVILDEQGRVRDANPEYVHLSGHAALEEIAGRNTIEWTAEHEKAKSAEAFRQCIQDGFIRNLEIDYAGKSGTIPIEINATVVTSGDSCEILALCRDISERRRSGRELKESEEKYRALIEHSQDGIFITQDQRLVFYNRALAEMVGYNDKELLGCPIDNLVAPEDREMVLSRYHARASGMRIPESYEYSLLHHDGVTRIRIRMYVGAGSFRGKPAFLGTVHNVTEDRKREDALRESEEQFQRLLSTSFDAIVIHQEGRIVSTNPAAARIVGYGSPAELIGKPVLDLVHPDYRDLVKKRISQMNNSALTSPLIEEKFVRADGTPVDVEVVATFSSYDGRPAVIGMFRDITRQKEAEKTILEANRKLSLLNTITLHDIANQLTALAGFTRIASGHNRDPVVGENLARIEAIADRINHQVEFTRSYQELGVKEPTWSRLETVVSRTKGDLPVTLSSPCGTLEIFADPLLERVFFNLFENTARHGGRATTISIGCEEGPDQLIITVGDNGIGIAPGLKEKIFERGFGKNTGWGLFFIREILSITGITIKETGTYGSGARFELVVPGGMFRYRECR